MAVPSLILAVCHRQSGIGGILVMKLLSGDFLVGVVLV
jgi:hypothetical protein